MERLALLTALCAISLLPQSSRGDEEAEKKGAALMDQYVEATGGQAAHEAVKSRIVRGERVLPTGETTKFESYWVYPDKFRSIIDVPLGTLERGSDGKIVWVSWPDGATVASGARRVAVLRESPRDRFGRWRDIFEKAEYAGDEDVDGTACSKVVLTYKPLDPKVPESPITVFIALDSGLIVKWTTEHSRQEAGSNEKVTATIELSDYRKVGDLLVAHKMQAALGDQTTSVKVQEVIYNTQIPADKLAPPKEVRQQSGAAQKAQR